MTKTYNLTEGKVSKILLGFFFPMLFTNLLQQIYTFADTAIVGKGLGDNALAAVGNLSSFHSLLVGFFMGMTNGFSIILAQRYGSGNRMALQKIIASSIQLSSILSIFFTAASVLSLKDILFAMQTSAIILQDSLHYGYILFGGLTATVAYNLFSSILRALGDSKTPFVAIMISSVCNILLDCICIFLLQTGVEGVAAATIFSQTLSAVICCCHIRKIDGIRLMRKDFKMDFSRNWILLKNGIPMACMNSITSVGCMIVQYYVNGMGVEYTSAYSVCNKYINLFMLPPITAGFAISSFTSQNYGAKKYDRISSGMQVSRRIVFVSYILFGIAMIIFPNQIVKIMLNGEKAIALAAAFLRICGTFFFSLQLLFLYRNAVQGMGHPFLPMCSGVLEMILRIGTIVLFVPRIGFPATAYAEVAAWTGALLLNGIAYKKYMDSIKRKN
ncbi:MAG: MATE family efflux transporter [Ruminococcus sp.]